MWAWARWKCVDNVSGTIRRRALEAHSFATESITRCVSSASSITAWVPALDIYNCKRRRGQHASYEGVATWRPSTSGRPAPERERNLKISGRGIHDFGDGRKYTPIDLVMAARGCTFASH